MLSRSLVRAMLGLMVAATALALTAASAAASPCSERYLTCEHSASVPGQTGDKEKAGQGGGGVRSCASELSGATIPCTTSDGTWSDQRQCYVKVDPNPPNAGMPGRTGAWYVCQFLP